MKFCAVYSKRWEGPRCGITTSPETVVNESRSVVDVSVFARRHDLAYGTLPQAVEALAQVPIVDDESIEMVDDCHSRYPFPEDSQLTEVAVIIEQGGIGLFRKAGLEQSIERLTEQVVEQAATIAALGRQVSAIQVAIEPGDPPASKPDPAPEATTTNKSKQKG